VSCGCCVLRRADQSSRGVLPTVVRCMRSRNLKNEEAIDRVGLQRSRKQKIQQRQRIT
jgi:hypothetical protein